MLLMRSLWPMTVSSVPSYLSRHTFMCTACSSPSICCVHRRGLTMARCWHRRAATSVVCLLAQQHPGWMLRPVVMPTRKRRSLKNALITLHAVASPNTVPSIDRRHPSRLRGLVPWAVTGDRRRCARLDAVVLS